MVMHESNSHADLFANKSVDDFVRLDVDLLQNKLELRNEKILFDRFFKQRTIYGIWLQLSFLPFPLIIKYFHKFAWLLDVF